MQSSQPLVSVVIPCYNHEQFVQDSIQSVIDQTYKNIELIIIDDGSRDVSVEKIQEMLEACKERFVRFEFRHRANIGLSATLNEALEWCEGEFYSPIASDDIMMPRKTRTQVEYLQRNSGCVGVYGEIELINSVSSKVKKIGNLHKYYFSEIFLHNHNLPTPTQMLRLDKVIQTGGYKNNILLEDWYINLKLTQNGESLDYIPVCLAKYRRHKDNLSSKNDLIHKGRLDVLKLYKDNQLYLQAKSKCYLVTANSLQLSNKRKSLAYFYKSVKTYPLSLKSKNVFKYIIKSAFSYDYLKKYYGEY